MHPYAQPQCLVRRSTHNHFRRRVKVRDLPTSGAPLFDVDSLCSAASYGGP